jgi:uncharacterized protein YecT (DUF1311 family)
MYHELRNPGTSLGARLPWLALLILALGGIAQAANDVARPEDRAAVVACLKTAASAPHDNVVSPTGDKIDPTAWMAYFARVPKPAAPNCVGVVSTPCLQSADGSASTGNMAECVTREYRVWDEHLNAAYKQWTQSCSSGKDDKACAARRNFERGWIAYRDALCGLPDTQHGGSFSSVEFADCMLNETARQAIWLEQQK